MIQRPRTGQDLPWLNCHSGSQTICNYATPLLTSIFSRRSMEGNSDLRHIDTWLHYSFKLRRGKSTLCNHIRKWNSVAKEELYILGGLDPLFFQEVHLDHVVPVALEILGAHQDLFLLCALGKKAKRYPSPSKQWMKWKETQDEGKNNDTASVWAGRGTLWSVSVDWRNMKTTMQKPERKMTTAKPTDSLIWKVLLSSFCQGGCVRRHQSQQQLSCLYGAKHDAPPLAMVNGGAVHCCGLPPG